jgi:hypothetical protein
MPATLDAGLGGQDAHPTRELRHDRSSFSTVSWTVFRKKADNVRRGIRSGR